MNKYGSRKVSSDVHFIFVDSTETHLGRPVNRFSLKERDTISYVGRCVTLIVH